MLDAVTATHFINNLPNPHQSTIYLEPSLGVQTIMVNAPFGVFFVF